MVIQTMPGTYWCMCTYALTMHSCSQHPVVGFPTFQHLFHNVDISRVPRCDVTAKLQDCPHTIGAFTSARFCTKTWSLSALIQLPRRLRVAGVLGCRPFLIYWQSSIGGTYTVIDRHYLRNSLETLGRKFGPRN